MKPLHLLIEAVLALLVLAMGATLLRTRSEVDALSQRVRALQTAQDAETTRTPAGGPVPRFVTGAAPALTGVSPGPTRREVESAVAAELLAMRERDRAADEQHRADTRERGRTAAARDLGLSPGELVRLEEMGAALRAAEEQRRQGPPVGREADLVQIARDADEQLRRFLGDARYQRVVDLRREHPEHARALPILRPPPAPAAAPARP